jgi:hypothetical protein
MPTIDGTESWVKARLLWEFGGCAEPDGQIAFDELRENPTRRIADAARQVANQ